MKKVKGATLLIGVFLLSVSVILAQTDFKKEYAKQFKINESTALKLVNKYGDMNIENWAENTVDIKVIVKVKTSSKSKADNTFGKISISFNEDANLVSAITNINESINNTEFSVDYFVKMPANISIDISNHYGNLFLNEINGFANINVKYGNFTINKMGRQQEKPTNYINVEYSSGICNINECGWLKLESGYSKIAIGTSTALIIGSRYSSLKIKSSKSIVTESKYDHPFKVGYVKNFVCTGAYSNFEITKLYNMLEADVKYSEVEVTEVGKDFELIKLKLRYGKASIKLPVEPGYDLKAESEYGTINYPGNYKINKIIDQSEASIWGAIGTNPKAKVMIDSKYATVDLE
jgi:hypothetical protein